MGFTVPNGADAATVDQAEPDALDYEALAVRSSGVVEGCATTAQLTPAMSVVVEAGKVVVDGVPVDVPGGSVTIQGSDANPRFDLVVADSQGTKLALRGTASASNPVFPDCDLTSYALLAAVYVGASTTSITNAAIVDKRIMLATTFQRSYASGNSTLVRSETPEGVFLVETGGKLLWVDAMLQRIGTQAMELTGSLLVKAGDAVASLLTLRARATSPESQKVLDIQNSSGTTVASITGTGKLQASNFLYGAGSPRNNIVAPKGTLYVDEAGARNRSLWISEGNGVWDPFRSFDPSDDSIPVGVIAPALGTVAPVGWLLLVGQQISTTDPETADLAALVGTLYGSGPETVGLPDFRGLIPIGAGGEVALSIGDVAGARTATIETANLPSHDHPVTDPGHAHPRAGRALYAPPTGSLKPSTDTGVTPFALVAEPEDTNRTSETGISVGPTGNGEPISILPPVRAVTWMVKAHATYARISAFEADSAIPVETGSGVAYMTPQDLADAIAPLLP